MSPFACLLSCQSKHGELRELADQQKHSLNGKLKRGSSWTCRLGLKENTRKENIAFPRRRRPELLLQKAVDDSSRNLSVSKKKKKKKSSQENHTVCRPALKFYRPKIHSLAKPWYIDQICVRRVWYLCQRLDIDEGRMSSRREFTTFQVHCKSPVFIDRVKNRLCGPLRFHHFNRRYKKKKKKKNLV